MPLNFRFISVFTKGFSLERRFYCRYYCSSTVLHVNQYGWCGQFHNCMRRSNNLWPDSRLNL